MSNQLPMENQHCNLVTFIFLVLLWLMYINLSHILKSLVYIFLVLSIMFVITQ